MPKEFWAYVKLISEKIGYTERSQGLIKKYQADEIKAIFKKLNLETTKLFHHDGSEKEFCSQLLEYLDTRSETLNNHAQKMLMDADQAASLFEEYKTKLNPNCPLPMNKQKGDKKNYAYLTGLVNMLIEQNCEGISCNYDPRDLTLFTRNTEPIRTLSRRFDGCFPHVFNPIAVWEIKEYYYTTTFGSRVAGGVYETLLDGMELEELSLNENIKTRHYLFVDSHYTWWRSGKSYLCRLYDTMQMGYVDEVIIGSEVIDRIPEIVSEWIRVYKLGPDWS